MVYNIFEKLKSPNIKLTKGHLLMLKLHIPPKQFNQKLKDVDITLKGLKN